MKDKSQLFKNKKKNLKLVKRGNTQSLQILKNLKSLIRSKRKIPLRNHKNGGMIIGDMEDMETLDKVGVMDTIQDGETGMDMVDKLHLCGKNKIIKKIKNKEIKDQMLYLALLIKILRFQH